VRLKAAGLPRRRDDTVASLRDRLATAQRAEAADRPDLVVMTALVGDARALDLIEGTVRRSRGWRASVDVALVPSARAGSAIDALQRLWPESNLRVPERRAEPADVIGAWVAAEFIRRLAFAGVISTALVEALAPAAPLPRDPDAAERAQRLVALLLESFDEHVEPEVPTPVSPSARRPGLDRALLRTLEIALSEDRAVAVTYRGGARQIVTRRTLEPRAIERRHSVVYLRAFCRWRQAVRLFRVDRITAVELLDERFAPEPLDAIR
jgi:hypothetical protein